MAKVHELYEKDVRTPFARRLQKLAKAWQRRVEAPLKKRQSLLALWASGYFNDGYTREHLINLIDRGVFTIVPYLVEGNPKVHVETKVPNLRPYAFTTQLAMNHILDEMDFAESVLVPAAINSMFGAGITRIFTEYNRRIDLKNESIKYGKPTVRVIDDANYIGDVVAQTRMDYAYEGDIYKLPTDYAKELYSKHADLIQADCKLTESYHPEKISDGRWDLNRLSLRDYTTFIDIYLYDENVTVTIMPEHGNAVILNEISEDLPGGSPYDVIGYKYFPGTTYPIPPAWAWHDLDVTMNILAKTAKEQAEAQKDIVLVDPQNQDLWKKILTAKNMSVMPASNPKELVNVISLGGVNPDNYNWMGFAEQMFTKTGSNPDVLAGRGAQAPTYGQEQMIFANASRIVNNMYSRWHSFMTSILKKLAWKVWTDPYELIPLIHTVPGVGEIPLVYSNADKVGEFYDFVYSVVPYSSQRTSPKQRYQELMGFLVQWILPTYGMAAQQGAAVDIPTVSRILSEYLGFENFTQWYKTAIPQEEISGINFQMMPTKNKNQQGNDRFGASQVSQLANFSQQQERTTGSPQGNLFQKGAGNV